MLGRLQERTELSYLNIWGANGALYVFMYDEWGKRERRMARGE